MLFAAALVTGVHKAQDDNMYFPMTGNDKLTKFVIKPMTVNQGFFKMSTFEKGLISSSDTDHYSWSLDNRVFFYHFTSMMSVRIFII